MDQEAFLAFELDCIRQAANMPQAQIRPVERPGGLRSRTYLLDGPDRGSFVKCLDAGYHNPAGFYLTLDREAEGYRFFANFDDGLAAVPEVHFYQSFSDQEGRALQVLGVTNLETLGAVRSPRDIYLDPAVPLARKEQIAVLCGRNMARLVSADFQNSLDRAVGIAANRAHFDFVLDDSRRETLVSLPENHETLPWAYQHPVLGEMNVFLPAWLEMLAQECSPETGFKLEQIGRVLTDKGMIEALSPGHSSDPIILSPRDRHDGNTLLVLDGDEVRQLFEVDMEFWGLETTGRLIGRYAATQSAAVRSNLSCWEQAGPQAAETLQAHYSCLMGAFLYHFIRGDGADSPELAMRAVSVGLGGFHAAILGLYVAALFPPAAPGFVDDVLSFLHSPGDFLALASDYAENQAGSEGEMVLDTLGQVWMAIQPLAELATGLLQGQETAP